MDSCKNRLMTRPWLGSSVRRRSRRHAALRCECQQKTDFSRSTSTRPMTGFGETGCLVGWQRERSIALEVSKVRTACRRHRSHVAYQTKNARQGSVVRWVHLQAHLWVPEMWRLLLSRKLSWLGLTFEPMRLANVPAKPLAAPTVAARLPDPSMRLHR